MSLTGTFRETENPAVLQPPRRATRPAPFSVRLSESDRSRLLAEANGVPLGAFIKAKLLDGQLPVAPSRFRRSGLAVEDRTALAQILALLGRSHMSNNLNQLAHASKMGALPITPETEQELLAALRDVRELRRLLLLALGLKPGEQP